MYTIISLLKGSNKIAISQIRQQNKNQVNENSYLICDMARISFPNSDGRWIMGIGIDNASWWLAMLGERAAHGEVARFTLVLNVAGCNKIAGLSLENLWSLARRRWVL